VSNTVAWVLTTRQDSVNHFVRIDPKSHIFGPVDVREFDVVEDQSHGKQGIEHLRGFVQCNTSIGLSSSGVFRIPMTFDLVRQQFSQAQLKTVGTRHCIGPIATDEHLSKEDGSFFDVTFHFYDLSFD